MLSKLTILIVLLDIFGTSNERLLRVIGGTNSKRDEFPFVVRLEHLPYKHRNNYTFEQFRLFCTGSTLTPTWTLTAAHCFYFVNKKLSEYAIFIRYKNHFPEIKGEISRMLKLYLHPRYVVIIEYVRYDIALVKTERITISQYGKLSAVDYTTLFGHEAHAMGYGITNVSEYPPPLQVIKGMLSKCSDKTGRKGIFAGLCLRVPCNVKATLTEGDSGGPVVHPTGIVAILSMGEVDYLNYKLISTKMDAEAGIYTSISPILDWILSIIRRK